MGTILKVKSGGSFISVPAIIGPQGPQGPVGPQGSPGNVSDVIVNGNSVVSSGIATINLVDYVYPIGSIYMSINSTNPGSLIGGTWVAWGTGRVAVGVDSNDSDFNTVEKTGGNKNLHGHTHSFGATSSDQSQSHYHGVSTSTGGASQGHTHWIAGWSWGQSANHYHDFTTNSDGAHSHSTQGRTSSGSTSPAIFESFAGTGGTRNVNVPRSGTNGTHSHSGSTGWVSSDHSHYSDFGSQGQSQDHTHWFSVNSGNANQGHTHTVSGTTGSTGSGSSQNLQPYITCYMWKRTA